MMSANRNRGPRLILSPLLVLLCLAGCHNTNEQLVEAELRTRERELRETREAAARLEYNNEALQRELWSLHHGAARVPPEVLTQVTSVQRIVLGRQTGGYSDERHPGDQALQVVLEPRDGEDQRVKAPGAVHIDVLEINAQGFKTPLSSWDIPPEQLRRTWREGLFGTGYYILLPWKVWPSTPSLRVVARLTLPDGRVFEADRDVKVRLPHQAAPHDFPLGEAGPLLPEPEGLLPPRVLETPPPTPSAPSTPGVPPPPRPLGPKPPPPPPPGDLESSAVWQPATSSTITLRRPLPLLK
jgi:hypothetical protein